MEWRQVTDASTKEVYYFNARTLEATWDEPDHWIPAEETVENNRATVEEEEELFHTLNPLTTHNPSIAEDSKDPRPLEVLA